MKRLGLLFDASRCVGCEGCVLACRETRGEAAPDRAARPDPAPETGPASGRGRSVLSIERRGTRNARRSCMHCVDPTCVSVCPASALRVGDDGVVAYDGEKCMGCRYCVFACPFDAPAYEWDLAAPRVRKCDLCVSRRAEGKIPACAEVCPTGAIAYGTRTGLLEEARRRIAGGGYVDRIYGVEEVGGTSVLVLSDVPFESLGLPELRGAGAVPSLSRFHLARVPDVGVGVACALWVLGWIIRRREIRAGEIRAGEGRPGA